MDDNKNDYIAYFDLLGTRGFCEDSNLYFENIKAFNESIEQLSSFLNGYGRVGVFSDCAYAESNDLSYLLEFLVELRDTLNARGLYFNAVVKKGKLGIESSSTSTSNCESMFGVKFTNSDIASLYIEQTNFKGVGIKIDEGIVNEVDSKQFSLVDCIYVASKEENHVKIFFPVKYKDISYRPRDEWEKTVGIDGQLNQFYTTFFSAYVKSPKFGAYYISALINLIKSYTTDFEWNPSDGGKIETKSKVFISVKQMLEKKYSDLEDLPGIEYLALALLDVVYDSDNLVETDKREITKMFMESMGCLKKKYMHSLNDVPLELFGEKNRNLFIKMCQEDLSSNFVKDVLVPLTD